MISKGNYMAKRKQKYISTNDEIIKNVETWHSNNRPLTNEEVVLWVEQNYGSAFIKGIGRTNYAVTCLMRYEDGEKEMIISLPRKQLV
jgi:hypothetical protein